MPAWFRPNRLRAYRHLAFLSLPPAHAGPAM